MGLSSDSRGGMEGDVLILVSVNSMFLVGFSEGSSGMITFGWAWVSGSILVMLFIFYLF